MAIPWIQPCRGFPQDDRLLCHGIANLRDRVKFSGQGLGLVLDNKPTFVLTSRNLPRTRDTVKFYSGDLSQFVNDQLRPAFGSIWFVGGGAVSGECLRRGLADGIRYSILPILIGDGVPFFEKLGRDVILHLAEVKAYNSGIMELRYDVRENRGKSRRHLTTSCSGIDSFGVPYGSRTRVAAVKEKRFVGIQRKPAAWIAP